MENIRTGEHGQSVLLHVEGEQDCEVGLVQIHLLNLEEKNVPMGQSSLKIAIQTAAQLMVNIASGICGRNVPSRAVEEQKCVQDLVQIHRRNMEVNYAMDQQTKQQIATRRLVQFVLIQTRSLNAMTKRSVSIKVLSVMEFQIV